MLGDPLVSLNTLPSNLGKLNLPIFCQQMFCLFVKLIYDFKAQASLALILSNFHDSCFCWWYKIKEKHECRCKTCVIKQHRNFMLHYVGTKKCMAGLSLTKVKETIETGKCILTTSSSKLMRS